MENYQIIEFEFKTLKNGSNFFYGYSYDPDIYNKIVGIYESGNKVQFEKWKWKFVKQKAMKDIQETILCPTLEDFNREIWDIFADFVEGNAVNIIWYCPMDLKMRNPYKPEVRGFDGVIFSRIHKEFMETTDRKNENVSRFLSCLVHFGYDCPQFRFVDKESDKLEGASDYSSFSLT